MLAHLRMCPDGALLLHCVCFHVQAFLAPERGVSAVQSLRHTNASFLYFIISTCVLVVKFSVLIVFVTQCVYKFLGICLLLFAYSYLPISCFVNFASTKFHIPEQVAKAKAALGCKWLLSLRALQTQLLKHLELASRTGNATSVRVDYSPVHLVHETLGWLERLERALAAEGRRFSAGSLETLRDSLFLEANGHPLLSPALRATQNFLASAH